MDKGATDMTDKRDTVVVIEQSLYAGTTATVELPEGMAWQDIKKWCVKWDTLHYTTDGETWHELELVSDSDEVLDWERPRSVYVMSLNHEEIEEQTS